MGDRTNVNLMVLAAHAKTTKELLLCKPDEISKDLVGFTTFIFYEINYGELDGLELLRDAGIPYESYWGQGSEYCPGTETCRFTPNGDAIVKIVYEEDLNISLASLMQDIEQPDVLVQKIRKAYEKNQVLSWDNQEDCGKRFRLKQLIHPNPV